MNKSFLTWPQLVNVIFGPTNFGPVPIQNDFIRVQNQFERQTIVWTYKKAKFPKDHTVSASLKLVAVLDA